MLAKNGLCLRQCFMTMFAFLPSILGQLTLRAPLRAQVGEELEKPRVTRIDFGRQFMESGKRF
jgi:hypothetical protein